MKTLVKHLATTAAAAACALATSSRGADDPAPPALTIYNGDFAVVREQVPLDLAAGENAVTFAGVTVQLEPDSVVLRDAAGRVPFQVLEQSYRADTVSQGLMLSLHEGKEIQFIARDRDQKEFMMAGRVIRSGYVPGGNNVAPLIEVDGKLRFSLPGEPVFPALSDDAILKPTLTWTIATERAAKFKAELGYVTGGMSWQAAYNLIAPEKGGTIDLIGWVTISNNTGKTFPQAVIKLMAGDVSKLQPGPVARGRMFEMRAMAMAAEPAVTEKAFDEFHLYSIARPTTLRDQETKQVEFIRATGVKSQTLYVYNGTGIDPGLYAGWDAGTLRNDRSIGAQSNRKVLVFREFENTEENGLGLPLPKGRTRFYRRDDADGRLEFTGENRIDHTARNETVRIYTGDAFDIVGERKAVDYVLNNRNDMVEEAFEIRLRNRKETPVEVRVIEPLYRGANWEIMQKSHDFTKEAAQKIEFRVDVPADAETVLTYRVRYSWR